LEADGRRLAKGGLILAATVGLLSACQTTDVAEEPAPAAVETAEQNQPVGTKMPSDFDGDLCKANDLQSLVGKPRTAIPVPVDVINRRVTCTTCDITEDYSPYRLNIFFNAETDIVEQVRCG